MKPSFAIAATLCLLGLLPAILTAQSSKPFTNADVVKMVKGGLPESVIISAIQSTPPRYDISPDALLALQKDGVTPREMDAIIAESKKAPSATEPAAPADSASSGHLPRVRAASGKNPQNLVLEKTQLAQTMTKPSSMSSLAGDSALNQAMRAGINTAAWDTAGHMNSTIGGASVVEGGSIVSSIMARRKPMITYVWGVSGVASKNVLHDDRAQFFGGFFQHDGRELLGFRTGNRQTDSRTELVPDCGCDSRQRRRAIQQ